MTNHKQKQINFISQNLDKLWHHIRYYDGQLYSLEKKADRYSLMPAQANVKARIIVVAATFYREQSLSFPVVDRKEIKKMLKLQHRDEQLNLVQRQFDNYSMINRWTLVENFPDAWVIIPESVLLTKHLADGEFCVLNIPNKARRIYAKVDNVIHSAQLRGVFSNEERFAMSIGVHNYSLKQVESEDIAGRLALGIRALSMQEILAFLKVKKQANWRQYLTAMIAPAAGLFVLYLSVSSIWLVAKGEIIKWQFSQLEQNLDELLYTQDALARDTQVATDMLAIVQQQPSYVGLLVSLVPVFESTRLSNIRYENGRYIIRGEVDQASELLEQISAQANVESAKFDLPVTQSRARERFTISLKLVPTLIIPSAPELNSKSE